MAWFLGSPPIDETMTVDGMGYPMLNACWGLQAQREAAVRTGNFLDLTAEADVSDEALEAIRAQVEA